eukprot:1876561-Lingulodinium_polyedra.AAC.1
MEENCPRLDVRQLLPHGRAPIRGLEFAEDPPHDKAEELLARLCARFALRLFTREEVFTLVNVQGEQLREEHGEPE